jgi:hypothetical protein
MAKKKNVALDLTAEITPQEALNATNDPLIQEATEEVQGKSSG